MARPISCDKERIQMNLARLRKGGNTFEVVIDPDAAVAFRQGKIIDVKSVLQGEKIFANARQGELASENQMHKIFGTRDPLKVAGIILKDGDIQLTMEFREMLREEKRKRIVELIRRNAIDPKTKLPHPTTRIENAFEQARVKVDEFKTAEEQVDEIVKKLRPIIPISIERLKLQLEIPPQQAHQSYGIIKRICDIQQETWGPDGTLVMKVELPAGLQEELMNRLNNLTHGGVEMRILK